MTSELYIVIPFYNAAATLPRTISSLQCLLPQSRQRVHIIGVDDGSEDDSSFLFKEGLAHVGLSYTLLQQTNRGSGAARNHALKTFSKGWTLFLDADDELVKDPFPWLDEAENASSLVFAAVCFRNGKIVGKFHPILPRPGKNRRLFSSRNPFCVLSVIFRREQLMSFFDEDLKFLEDWHFFSVNEDFWAQPRAFPEITIGRVHAGAGNKSSDQYQQGCSRTKVACRLEEIWENSDLMVNNNLAIQKAIGRIQMLQGLDWWAFMCIPSTPSLYVKYFLYAFFYKTYLAVYPYR